MPPLGAPPPPRSGERTGLESKPRELSQAGLCEQREGNDTGRKKKQIKEKTQQQLGLHQPPARAPHCARAPPPSGSRSGSFGPSELPRRTWALDPPPLPRGAPAARPGRRLRSGLCRAGPPARAGEARIPAPAEEPLSRERGGRAGAGGPQPGSGGLSMPVRRRPRVLLPSARGGATRSSAGTGRGGGDTHPWWRWRRRRLGPECHLRSRGCMPGARAAGTAAGLAPRGGRGLHSGPPPPPQAPAPAPPATGRCGMGRVARYIPGSPRLGPARPRRRRSARPPASPSVPQSLRPATVLHLRNAPKNKPLVAQLAPLSVTHRSARQSQAFAGPWYHPSTHFTSQ